MSPDSNDPVERPADQPFDPVTGRPAEHPTGERQAGENDENDPPA